MKNVGYTTRQLLSGENWFNILLENITPKLYNGKRYIDLPRADQAYITRLICKRILLFNNSYTKFVDSKDRYKQESACINLLIKMMSDESMVLYNKPLDLLNDEQAMVIGKYMAEMLDVIFSDY